MVSRLPLALLLLLELSQGEFCPIFACSDLLASSVCAIRVASDAYQINSNGCPSSYECLGVGIYSWMSSLTASFIPTNNNEYDCTPAGDFYQIDPNTWTYATCYPKETNRSFKNGQMVNTCKRDIDCQLRDGSHTICDCVFRTDGQGVCIPDISDDNVFAGYWKECGDNMRINNRDIYAYWSTYRELFTILQSNIPCLDVIAEIGVVSTLKSTYESGMSLVLAGLVFLY